MEYLFLYSSLVCFGRSIAWRSLAQFQQWCKEEPSEGDNILQMAHILPEKSASSG